MVPHLLIDTAPVPGGGELRLFRRGDDWSIMLGGNELMSSRLSGSEEALATLAAKAMAERAAPRVLIGGLGMGFTLRAALAAMPCAEIVVAELVAGVIDWARGPLAALHGRSLDDSRLRIETRDVADAIGDGGWDSILLDVDNGPDGLTLKGNDRLYSRDGLARARRALRPGGVLAIWSAHPDAAFARRLRDGGFSVREEIVRARGDKGARHVIWTATTP